MKMLKKAILLLILSLILITTINITYAKYKDQIKGTTNIQIASWEIKVNDETIKNKEKLEANITPVLPGNDYIKPNILAPGATGYYDIVIDGTNADVAFNFDIIVEKENENILKDLIITGYEFSPTSTPNPIPYQNSIQGTITLNQKKITARIYIEWNDSDTNIMDNEEDTKTVINNTEIKLTNKITFTQTKS